LRGALHDPPRPWSTISVETYFALADAWPSLPRTWLRSVTTLRRLAARLPVEAYQVPTGEGHPGAALLLHRPAHELVHVLDIVWDPDVGPRNLGRYLLQELYMHIPQARVFLAQEPVDSPLSRVLAALGYRVHGRLREWQWHKVTAPGEGDTRAQG